MKFLSRWSPTWRKATQKKFNRRRNFAPGNNFSANRSYRERQTLSKQVEVHISRMRQLNSNATISIGSFPFFFFEAVIAFGSNFILMKNNARPLKGNTRNQAVHDDFSIGVHIQMKQIVRTSNFCFIFLHILCYDLLFKFISC